MSYLYYSPDVYDLTPVAEWDAYDEPYSFSIVAVWRDSAGKLWGAADEGCSCPTPFEGHTFPTDFVEIRTIDDLQRLLDVFPDDSYYRSRKSALDFVTTIRRELG